MFWYERLGNKTSILHTEISHLKPIRSRSKAPKDSPLYMDVTPGWAVWFLRISKCMYEYIAWYSAQLKCPLPVSFTQGAIVPMKRKGRHFKKTFTQDFSLSLL